MFTIQRESSCFLPIVNGKRERKSKDMRNLKIEVCYDGTRYKGWQRLQNAENTIQGKVEGALSRILSEPIEVLGSGRTDAGVHAKGQVANFRCNSAMPAVEILSQLRRYLPSDIGIYSCRDVSEHFHARLNAKAKTYCYRLWVSDQPCVFDRRFMTVMPMTLDLKAMRRASECFVGVHDFSAFCTNSHMKKSTVREIYWINIEKFGDEIRFTVKGNGFLYNMMRILVGTLVEVGSGKRAIESIPLIFGQKRSASGMLMPPTGLCLMEVEY